MTKKKTTAESRLVRVACEVEGHVGEWVEFETAHWGLGTFRRIMESSLHDGLTEWVEADSTDWRLAGDEAPVPHPGKGADLERWLEAYDAFGPVSSEALFRWLGSAPYMAVLELTQPPKKSDAGGEAPG